MSKDKNRPPGPNDPGILRKKEDEKDKELLVFGYSCKLFRDDAKASEIDRGLHLINWVDKDNNAMLIDRYDARVLNDLSMHEKSGNHDVLTPEEKHIETLCNDERYRSLKNNEEETQLYQEEEIKRLRQALNQENSYGQVAYSYSDAASEGTTPARVNAEPPEEPFVPNPLVYLPQGMVLPTTKNQHIIMEKTASMVNNQGVQMEVILKVKQGSNPKFKFLHAEDPLNPYYVYIREQMKTGKYKPLISSKGEESQTGSYLPPITTTPHSIESAPTITTIPNIAYKPTEDCAYNQLVNKIKSVQKVQNLTEPKKSPKFQRGSKMKVPPEEIREIIKRLVTFIRTNNMEPSELTSRLASNPKMDFLTPAGEYHEYYLTQLEESISNETTANKAEPECDEESEHSALDNKTSHNEPMDLIGSSASDDIKQEILSNDMQDNDSDSLNESMSSGVKPVRDTTSTKSYVDGSYSDSDQPNMYSNAGSVTPPSKESPKGAKTVPISFSIKKPVKEEKLEIASALPVESDSDGGDVATQGNDNPNPPSNNSDHPDLVVPTCPKEVPKKSREKHKQAKAEKRARSVEKKSTDTKKKRKKKKDERSSTATRKSSRAPINGGDRGQIESVLDSEFSTDMKETKLCIDKKKMEERRRRAAEFSLRMAGVQVGSGGDSGILRDTPASSCHPSEKNIISDMEISDQLVEATLSERGRNPDHPELTPYLNPERPPGLNTYIQENNSSTPGNLGPLNEAFRRPATSAELTAFHTHNMPSGLSNSNNEELSAPTQPSEQEMPLDNNTPESNSTETDSVQNSLNTNTLKDSEDLNTLMDHDGCKTAANTSLSSIARISMMPSTNSVTVMSPVDEASNSSDPGFRKHSLLENGAEENANSVFERPSSSLSVEILPTEDSFPQPIRPYKGHVEQDENRAKEKRNQTLFNRFLSKTIDLQQNGIGNKEEETPHGCNPSAGTSGSFDKRRSEKKRKKDKQKKHKTDKKSKKDKKKKTKRKKRCTSSSDSSYSSSSISSSEEERRHEKRRRKEKKLKYKKHSKKRSSHAHRHHLSSDSSSN